MSRLVTHQHLRVDPDSPLPLAAQLADQLRWLIARGELNEGDSLPPIRVLAEALGINFNTVRAAYKQLEAEGLVAAQRGKGTTVLGYIRGTGAKRPSLRSFTIGVIIPAHTVFYLPFLNVLEQATGDPSLLFVCNAQQDPANGLMYLDQLVAKNVDGILVMSIMIPEGVDLRGPNLPPIVCADYPGAPGPSILFDHHQGSSLATQHMVDHGHRRIAFLAPPRELPNVAPKYDGYENTLRQQGVAIGPVETSIDFSVESARVSARKLLTRPDRPTAIVAASDNHAIAVMQEARELGVAIPADIALIGNDNIMFAGMLQPSLSSVDVPLAEMGRQAMAMLLRLIAGKQLRKKTVTLGAELVARESCGCEASRQ